jgi:hypothetical protein
MQSIRNRRSLKHLGSLHGSGKLLDGHGGRSYGPIVYEIDGYFDHLARSDNGRIQGGANMLSLAFLAGPARIALADGQVVDVVLEDPRGDVVAEITVKSRFPEFADNV